MIDWKPIDTHPGDEDECLIAIFRDGVLYVADRGWWQPGEVHEEWDRVEDDVAVKIYEEEEPGSWLSNHVLDALSEPTHWAPLETSDSDPSNGDRQ